MGSSAKFCLSWMIALLCGQAAGQQSRPSTELAGALLVDRTCYEQQTQETGMLGGIPLPKDALHASAHLQPTLRPGFGYGTPLPTSAYPLFSNIYAFDLLSGPTRPAVDKLLKCFYKLSEWPEYVALTARVTALETQLDALAIALQKAGVPVKNGAPVEVVPAASSPQPGK